ncbi:MAG: hypothetical protein KIT13_09120, partial [Burkholderiales bacterium]|nr:hypothetical protein [Burkholderiales bacterium]
HILQVIDALAADGLSSEEFVLAALVHDLGKVVLLRDRSGENPTFLPGFFSGTPGAGLDHCASGWSTDELAWLRLKDYLPPPVAWLIRYHGIDPAGSAPYFDARDREYAERYLMPFRECDFHSKSPFSRPKTRLEDYRPLVEKHLPLHIVF